jgi:very-short-patch-repair endonuclease
VPPFEQNARIDLPDGGYYVADFLWRELRAILEIDSVEHHFDLADWEATMDRHLVLETLGFSVTHRPPTAIRDRPRRFVRDISAWLTARAALCR